MLPLTCFLFLSLSYVSNTFESNFSSGARLHTTEDFFGTFFVKRNKPRICENSSSPVVIMINSAASYFHQRFSIRSTWVSEARDRGLPYVFVIGSADNETMVKVREEDIIFGDMIIGKFGESYYNLTLKSVFELGWARTFCPNKWALLIDDDSILNVGNLVKYISGLRSDYKAIYCSAAYTDVKRENNVYRRYFVSNEIYAPDFWPWRCSGVAYLISPPAVAPLHEACLDEKTEPKLWIEDIYVTGFAAISAGIPRMNDRTRFIWHKLSGSHLDVESFLVLGNMGKGNLYVGNLNLLAKARSSDSEEARLSGDQVRSYN